MHRSRSKGSVYGMTVSGALADQKMLLEVLPPIATL